MVTTMPNLGSQRRVGRATQALLAQHPPTGASLAEHPTAFICHYSATYLDFDLALSVLASAAGRLFSFASVGVSTGVLQASVWEYSDVGVQAHHIPAMGHFALA